MFTPLAGLSVIVTGASQGIGKALAYAFADNGAKVLLVARDVKKLNGAKEEIMASNRTVSTFAGSVVDADAMARMAKEAEMRHGGIDILCANASTASVAYLGDLKPAQWSDVISTNLTGTFLTITACLPELRRSGRGRIIITSSITGPLTGISGWSHYSASKAGQLGFMRSIAIELAANGITVNAILPGNIATKNYNVLGEALLRSITASIPLGRLGSVEDIANAALFLASEEAAYITGQTIVVDGGQTLPEWTSGT